MQNILDRIRSVDAKLKDLDRQIAQDTGVVSTLNGQIAGLEASTKQYEENTLMYDKEIEILRKVQESSQAVIKDAFEKPSSQALEYVFGPGNQLLLHFDTHGNTQTMQPYIVSPDFDKPVSPADGESGGKVNLANLVLRSMILEVIKPKNTAPLMLDEALNNIRGESLSTKTGEFLVKLQEKTGRQMILSAPNFIGQFANFHTIEVNDDEKIR